MAEDFEKGDGEEKRDGKVSGFFKNLGKKFNDATYDMRMQIDFDSTHKKYLVCSGTALLTPTPEIAVEEHLEDGYLLTPADDEQIAAGNLVQNTETGEVRHIAAVEKATLKIEFEGKSNTRPALKIVLGDLAKKVDVIKVGNEFYLK